MVEAQGKMQTEKVIAYMIIAGLIGFLIDTIMVLAEKVLLKMESSIGNIKRHGHQIACYLSDARISNAEQTTGIKFLNVFYICI